MKNREIDIHTHRADPDANTLRTAGIHPWDAEGRHSDELTHHLETIDAIGEIGLDFVRGPERETQIQVLRAQLALAQEHNLPVVLHCVRAFEPLMKLLAEYSLPAVIFHGFIGSLQQARQAVERGYYLSFGERAFASPKTLDALRSTPLDRIFCETDESSLPIGEIYRRTAEVRGVCLEELTHAIEQNYKRIFKYNDR